MVQRSEAPLLDAGGGTGQRTEIQQWVVTAVSSEGMGSSGGISTKCCAQKGGLRLQMF